MRNNVHRSAFCQLPRASRLLLFVSCLLPSVACSAAIAPVEMSSLPNGSTLLVRRDKVAPRVGISLLVRAGAADETAANAGWRQILSAALLRATRLDSATATATATNAPHAAVADSQTVVRLADWQRRLEQWGGRIGATVDDDSIEFWITGDSAHTADLMRTLLQIVLRPRLADEDFVAARRRVLALQNQAGNAVAARAAQSIATQLYVDAKGDPIAYAHPDYGSFESLSSLTNEQLRDRHAQFFIPARLLVSAAGDVDPALLRTELERAEAVATAAVATAAVATEEVDEQANVQANAEAGAQAGAQTDTRVGAVDIRPAFGPLNVNRPPLVVREMGAGGAWVFVAFRTPGVAAMSPTENAALQVLAAALEGSAQARLPRRLLGDVDKPFDPNASSNALAAQTAAQWTMRRWAGELTVFAQTGPQNVDAVKNALLDEIRKLRETPLSNSELQNARDYARGDWSVSRSQLRERAFAAALAALHSSTPDTKRPDYLQAVTAADVQSAAERFLRVYSVVLIMPQD